MKKNLIIFVLFIIILGINTIGYSVDMSDKVEENARNLGYQQGLLKAYENNSKNIQEPYYMAWFFNTSDILKDYKKFFNDFEEKYSVIIETAYREGFKIGYNEAIIDRTTNVINIKEEKLDYAEKLGKILGEIYGHRDYYNKNKSNYLKAIPTDKKIIEMYNLNQETSQFRHSFLKIFKQKFKEGYNEGFRKANFEPIKTSYENGYNQGKDIGVIIGKANATKDYYLKLKNDWKRHAPTEIEIKNEYNLFLESERFREGFISGFREGLFEGYTNTFQNLNKEQIQNKTTAETVSIAGGKIYSLDKAMSLNIDKGTYYNPIVVAIDILLDNSINISKDFIKASDFYKINILNKSKESNNKRNLELKFQYYGKEDGGIYKLVNNKLIYLPSEIEDGFISTKINSNSFKEKDNIYCVLVDKKFQLLSDIRGHWAKDEIITFLRRGLVSGYSDKTFEPDKNITRGEFLTILSRIYNWQIPNTVENIKEFKDYNTFKSYNGVISYAINKGYINGYSDNTFKPHKPISYREVENIMKKVTNTEKFYWSNYSSKMLYEKDYRSKSFDNINNNITRAEIVYMLYKLNEWKY